MNFSLVRTPPVTRTLKVDVRVVHVRRPLAVGRQERQPRRRARRRRRRLLEERQRQEDEETADDLQQPAVATAQQAVPEDAVPRATRESGASGEPWTDADAGKFFFIRATGNILLLTVRPSTGRTDVIQQI